ncbi:hypothetical protein AAG906_034766 [Vitis piasezkii]
MQSRLAAKATTSYRVFSLARNRAMPRGPASAPNNGRTADLEIYTADPGIKEDLVHPRDNDKIDDSQQRTEDVKPSQETVPFVPPKPPYAASPRLETTGVNRPLDPITQQKRSISTDAICAGVDGTLLPNNEEGEQRRREMEEEDYRAYYSHHKASPLSEIEVVDTRKPITRATDGTYGDHEGDKVVIGWLPEQLDTAEEALQRANEIWKQSAMRGDPDSPQSRVLRALRGDY